jgi:hypothetical protein
MMVTFWRFGAPIVANALTYSLFLRRRYMKITPKLISELGFKYISSPVTDDLSRGNRWEKMGTFGLIDIVQDKNKWIILFSGGGALTTNQTIKTIEDLLFVLYDYGVECGKARAKKELRDWLGY